MIICVTCGDWLDTTTCPGRSGGRINLSRKHAAGCSSNTKEGAVRHPSGARRDGHDFRKPYRNHIEERNSKNHIG